MDGLLQLIQLALKALPFHYCNYYFNEQIILDLRYSVCSRLLTNGKLTQ